MVIYALARIGVRGVGGGQANLGNAKIFTVPITATPPLGSWLSLRSPTIVDCQSLPISHTLSHIAYKYAHKWHFEVNLLVCIAHLQVIWGPGKFGLKKGDIVTFFYRFFTSGLPLGWEKLREIERSDSGDSSENGDSGKSGGANDSGGILGSHLPIVNQTH